MDPAENRLRRVFERTRLPASAWEAFRNTQMQPNVSPRSTIWIDGKPFPYREGARRLGRIDA